MYRARVIPCLLVRGNGLVKTRKFKDAVYIGDPVNAVRIFSEKEADEIVVLDIDASREGREPNYELIAEMAGEAFMPVAYGGGVRTLEQIRRLIRSGVEKVVINTAATVSTDSIRAAADVFGSQAIVGAVDVRRKLFGGYAVVSKSGSVETKLNLQQHMQNLVEAGVGELLINDIDRDGTMVGYDMALVHSVARATVPVVVCGGAGTLAHLREAVRNGGASAVAAGSMFVFHGKHRAVLINYPKVGELEKLFTEG
ncbi:MAG: AglZ/HisF2 family acetamidino modification protein [Hydrogenophaga sp.]|uniref:AglZ/HisF2 family acetamidino modification protein n=1 Tax=Hydrogenophaga sp. TaxID=1904254 RepID=UPI002742E7FE|nr:AglZ/HisF2 family acetamidino modification protein [Hydrogenophaga sp.]MDP2416299.1 AglZ/HisF2 family acetamidino modification protein [Hydrogenophaga sp.]MDZ4190370.1 AglZ/HisF2 family acetamidino modification protein [Hydrogenophaga sp.]